MENPTVGKILKTLVFPEYCLKVPVISKFVKSRKVPNTGRSVKMAYRIKAKQRIFNCLQEDTHLADFIFLRSLLSMT